MDFENFFEEVARNQKIGEVSFFINNLCNLACRFCYVQRMPSDGRLVSNDDWLAFFLEAIRNGVSLVSIVGKEPLMTPKKTIDLLQRLPEGVKKGLVSNFTLITPEIAGELSKIDNLYLDISLDGVPDVHDSLRGEGSFTKSLRGIECLKKAGADSIIVSHMVNSANIETFPKFVEACLAAGLNRIVFFPYCYLGDNGDPYKLTAEQYCKFIQKILTPGFLPAKGLKLLVKTDYLTPDIMMAVIENFIDPASLREDENGYLVQFYEVAGNAIYFGFCPFPIEFSMALRLNYNGDAVVCRDMMRPDIEAIGNIREGFPALRRKLSTSKRVRGLYREFYDFWRSR